MAVKLNEKAPDFRAPSTSGLYFDLPAMAGYPLVIYFYPKDNTPGCTTEAMNFRDRYGDFTGSGAVLVGVSRDSLKSHEGFKSKLDLPFELLSDADETVCKLFDVIKVKKMYGKNVRGIERSTFLIDRKGVLRKEWRGIKVPGHVDEVLDALKQLA
ncbi:MAG: peroxiredoxin [Candidatus Protistobacter heckmanni]|nr:peroxiredoxin [Candidatus Protistobacter heckmanni]